MDGSATILDAGMSPPRKLTDDADRPAVRTVRFPAPNTLKKLVKTCLIPSVSWPRHQVLRWVV